VREQTTVLPANLGLWERLTRGDSEGPCSELYRVAVGERRTRIRQPVAQLAARERQHDRGNSLAGGPKRNVPVRRPAAPRVRPGLLGWFIAGPGLLAQ
jgi:hypothetical protein